jgi:hypothetical protein
MDRYIVVRLTTPLTNRRTQMSLDDLFSLDPKRRLDAAKKTTAEEKQKLLRDWPVDFPQVNGSRNAWIVSVGPSPGLNKDPKKAGHDATTTNPLNIGVPCDFFKSWETPFGKNLLGVVHAAFQDIGLSAADSESLFLHINLDTILQGQEKRTGEQKLRDGLPRLWTVIEKVKPRLIVALTKEIYKSIREGFPGETGSPSAGLPDETPQEVEAGGKSYHWKSCWLNRPGVDAILLTEILQHPSHGGTVPKYQELVGKYLASRIQEILRPSR